MSVYTGPTCLMPAAEDSGCVGLACAHFKHHEISFRTTGMIAYEAFSFAAMLEISLPYQCTQISFRCKHRCYALPIHMEPICVTSADNAAMQQNA